MKKLKQFIYDLIEVSDNRKKYAICYDIVLFACIFISSICVIAQLVGVEESLDNLLIRIEHWITWFFIVEYLLKLWVSDIKYPQHNKLLARWEFIISFESFIDLISIFAIVFNNIPSELAAIKLLKVTKLVRLFKLTEIFKSKQHKFEGIEKFKVRIYEIICKDENNDIISKIYDIFSIIIIFISVIILIIDTFNIPDAGKNILHIIEYIIAGIFTLEYLIRIWTSSVEYPDCDPDKAKMKYIFSFMALIDLLSILPVFLTKVDATLAIVKILKLFKILRLVKMSRYLSSINNFILAVASKKKQILFSMVTVVFLMVLCSVFIYAFEHVEQPDIFNNALSGIMYSFVMLTGIGDSAIEPITTLGKTFSTIMAVLGVCVFAVPVTIVTEEFMKTSKEAANKKEEDQVINLDISNLSERDRELLINLYNSMKEND